MTDIVGTSGNDTLDADFVSDTVEAGSGDDLVIVTVGVQNDSTQGSFDGGDGFDTLDLSGIDFNIDFDLTPDGENTLLIDGVLFGFGMLMATFSNFERIIGGSSNDLFIANGNLSIFDGGEGSGNVAYFDASQSISVDLEVGLGIAGAAQGHQFINISGIFGTDFNDTLVGLSASANSLSGGDGDDSLTGGISGDDLNGGDGNDTLIGNDGDDIIDGGAGADLLAGGAGDDTFEIFGDISSDTIQGGEGRDRLISSGTVTGDIDLINGNITGIEDINVSGNDVRITADNGANDIRVNTSLTGAIIIANGGDDTVEAGFGDDFISGGAGVDVVTGLEGNDQIFASATDTGADIFIGGAGDDTIGGGRGDDFIVGDAFLQGFSTSIIEELEAGDRTADGSDVIFGGAGDDTLLGGSFDDRVVEDGQYQQGEALAFGFAPNVIWGGSGNDLVLGASGDDTLGGGAGDDTLGGGGGDDVLYGGQGDDNDTGLNDLLSGGAGDDMLFAGAGSDSVLGGSGSDQLFGEAGNDTLDGGDDADTLNGGDGDDTLIGGLGGDSLIGAEGADTFVFAAGHGADRVADFTTTDDILDVRGIANDFTDLESLIAASEFVIQGRISGVTIDTGEGDSIFLQGLTIADLDGITVLF